MGNCGYGCSVYFQVNRHFLSLGGCKDFWNKVISVSIEDRFKNKQSQITRCFPGFSCMELTGECNLPERTKVLFYKSLLWGDISLLFSCTCKDLWKGLRIKSLSTYFVPSFNSVMSFLSISLPPLFLLNDVRVTNYSPITISSRLLKKFLPFWIWVLPCELLVTPPTLYVSTRNRRTLQREWVTRLSRVTGWGKYIKKSVLERRSLSPSPELV